MRFENVSKGSGIPNMRPRWSDGVRRLLAPTIAVAGIAAVVALGQPAHANAALTNLAQGRPAVASDLEVSDGRFTADMAFDGDTTSASSRWSSTADAPTNGACTSKQHWIRVDLGETKTISQVKLTWSNRKAEARKIQVTTDETVSDSTQWTDVWSSTTAPAEDAETVNFTATQARHVRLVVTKHTYKDLGDDDAWGNISLYEMEVMGEGTVTPSTQDPSENVARGKTAVADSVEATTLPASKAFDGDAKSKSSRWASAVDATANKEGGPHWIYVDLGQQRDVKTIRITWEMRKAKGYKIQVANTDTAPAADSTDWQTVYTNADRPAKRIDTIKLDSVQHARFVRLYIDHNTYADPDGGTAWGNISLYEMEVYGGEAPLSMDELASQITVETPKKGDTQLKWKDPGAADYEVTYNGTDLEQVVGDGGKIYQPLVDKTVKVSFKVSEKADPTNYTFKEVTVTIPGRYTQEEGDNAAPVVLPALAEWKGAEEGSLAASAITQVNYADDTFKKAAEEFVADYEDIFGKKLPLAKGSATGAGIVTFKVAGEDMPGLGDEGYYLSVDGGITVSAETNTGAYWATRTILMGLKTSGDSSLPYGTARDYPLYEARGLILDVGRKTFTLDWLQDTVKLLSWYKMNDFQVHLNDNYIWVEEYNENKAGMDADSWKKPYSGFRLESDIKEGGNNGKNKADLTSTDVWYTKDDFRAFIKEAKSLGVNIVPEFDMPAHSLALTKVRPDLRTDISATKRGNDHLNLKGKYDESLEFALSIWDEYLQDYDGKEAVFADADVVHIGADEYEADGNAYRRFVNALFEHVEETGHTARVWGSLKWIKGNVEVSGKDANGNARQVNMWSKDWADMNEMYKLGFEMVNCIDSRYYMVPDANYYNPTGLNHNTIFNSDNVNNFNGVTIPAGDKQMIGGAFAIWNDMCFTRDKGTTQYDVYTLVKDAAIYYSAAVWGKGSMTVNDAGAIAAKAGEAPNTDFKHEVEVDGTGAAARYKMNGAKDSAGMVDDLACEGGATFTTVDGASVLALGSGDYATTGLTTVGLGNEIKVRLKRTGTGTGNQVLFEGAAGTIWGAYGDEGKVAFTRENMTFTFDYTIPEDEWVTLSFRNERHYTKLYVDGELVGTVGGKAAATDGGAKIWATFQFPLDRIGTNGKTDGATTFACAIDELRVGQVETEPRVPGVTGTSCSEETVGEDGALSNVLDGDTSTIWHTRYKGTADHEMPHVMTLTLPEPTDITAFTYVPRTDSSKNGRLKKYRLEASFDNGATYETVAEGTVADPANPTKITFAPKTRAAGADGVLHGVTNMKLYFLETEGDSAANANKFATAAEVYLSPVLDVDKSALEQLVDVAVNGERGDNTVSSWKAYQAEIADAIKAAQAVLEDENATAVDVEDMVEEFSAILKAASEKLVMGASAAQIAQGTEKMTAYGKLDSAKYTAETWKTLAAAAEKLQQGIDEAADGDVARDDFMALMAAYDEAFLGLKEAGKTDPEKPTVDKSELHHSIYIKANIDVSGYTKESIAKFFAKMDELIDAAQKVMADENATQAEVDAANDALLKGIEEAKGLLVKEPDKPGTTDPEKPGSGEEKPSKPEKKPGSGLPQTGDAAMVAVGLSSAGGILALAAGASRKRRK